MTPPRANSPQSASGTYPFQLAGATFKTATDSYCSFDYDYNDMTTVLVGKTQEKFTVHRDIICENWRYFEAACRSDRWLEGKEKTVPLSHINSATFKTYLHWTMTGKLLPEVYWARENIEAEHEQWVYIEAYIVGDFLDDAKYRNHVMGAMIVRRRTWDSAYSDDMITRIWEGTPEKSPLRTFTLEWMRATWCRESIAELTEGDDVPTDFIKEALVLLAKNCPFTSRSASDKKLSELLLPAKDNDDDESSKTA
jgi:hypothetical protein